MNVEEYKKKYLNNQKKISESELRSRLLQPLDELQSQRLNEADSITYSETPNDLNLSLEQYVANPTGKGSGYVANRAAIKSGLNMTFIKLLRNHRRQFYAVPYIYGNGDILFYVKVPSEDYKDNKISYDVLFLIQHDKNRSREKRLIKLYSNSPSFIFTYCYVYNQHNLIIEKLKSKLPTEALTQFPEIRNPIGSLGYEKSTYIAAMYLLNGKCLRDEYINRYGITMNSKVETETYRKIANPELLVSIYQHAKYKARKEHRKPITKNEEAKRDKIQARYAEKEKKNTPKKSGMIIATSPRSKITARKAKKAILNDSSINKKKK